MKVTYEMKPEDPGATARMARVMDIVRRDLKNNQRNVQSESLEKKTSQQGATSSGMPAHTASTHRVKENR